MGHKSSEEFSDNLAEDAIAFDRTLSAAYNEFGSAILLLLHLVLQWREVWQ
jgi:hypothetical protein